MSPCLAEQPIVDRPWPRRAAAPAPTGGPHIDAFTPAVALTRQLFVAYQSSAAAQARRQVHAARPDTPGRKTAQES